MFQVCQGTAVLILNGDQAGVRFQPSWHWRLALYCGPNAPGHLHSRLCQAGSVHIALLSRVIFHTLCGCMVKYFSVHGSHSHLAVQTSNGDE